MQQAIYFHVYMCGEGEVCLVLDSFSVPLEREQRSLPATFLVSRAQPQDSGVYQWLLSEYSPENLITKKMLLNNQSVMKTCCSTRARPELVHITNSCDIIGGRKKQEWRINEVRRRAGKWGVTTRDGGGRCWGNEKGSGDSPRNVSPPRDAAFICSQPTSLSTRRAL